jgi:hypothetical protein
VRFTYKTSCQHIESPCAARNAECGRITTNHPPACQSEGRGACQTPAACFRLPQSGGSSAAATRIHPFSTLVLPQLGGSCGPFPAIVARPSTPPSPLPIVATERRR